MNTNSLKIAWRAAWKSNLFTFLNIFGLGIGFAGFVLAYAYINRENSYDAWNRHYKNIYLIGLQDKGKASDLTPGALAPAIKASIPEVAEVGRIARATFEVPFISDDDMFYVKNWLVADKSIASIFSIEANGLAIGSSTESQIGILSPKVGKKLFPTEKQGAFAEPKLVALLNEQSGVVESINGIAKDRALSNLEYDYIAFIDDLAKKRGDDDINAYQTYIRINPGTDPKILTRKINNLYQEHIAQEKKNRQSTQAGGQIYLDALKYLHLRPKNGSDIGYKIVLSLGILSLIILLLACINFANLMLVQAQERSKEIAMKKVFGVSRNHLALQFLFEVFAQCLTAALIAIFLTVIAWNTLTNFFGYGLSSFDVNHTVIIQLAIAVLLTTIVSGVYPAIVLSGYQPVTILKGNLRSGHQSHTFRNGLLTFQFFIAFVFMSSMLVISKQMAFIKKGARGFNVDQVVYIKTLATFNKPNDFKDIRNRMKAIPGISEVTVATHVPGGVAPQPEDFVYRNQHYAMNHIGVDFEYFETLGMVVDEGRVFSPEFPGDTTNGIVLNKTAAQALGLKHPIGESIQICDISYRVIGLVKDGKMQGFEELVKPTAYTLQTNCSLPQHPAKYEMMAKLESGKIRSALNELEKKWSTINKTDGKYFIYEFLDQKYAALYAKQEQLQQAFTAFTGLITLVALMGLFSMSAYAISLRQKEVGIRKVFGANTRQIILLLNKPFIHLVVIAMAIATPIAFWGTQSWLDTFAYRIELSWWYFVIAAIFALAFTFITVSYHAIKAGIVNPVNTLRDE